MELSKGLKLLIFGVKAQKESILAKIEVLAGNKRDREEEQFWEHPGLFRPVVGEVGLFRSVVGDVGELVRGWLATGGGGRSPKIRIEHSTDRKRGRRGPCTVTALCPLPNQTTWDQPTRPLLRCTTSGHYLEIICSLTFRVWLSHQAPLFEMHLFWVQILQVTIIRKLFCESLDYRPTYAWLDIVHSIWRE